MLGLRDHLLGDQVDKAEQLHCRHLVVAQIDRVWMNGLVADDPDDVEGPAGSLGSARAPPDRRSSC